MDENVEETMVLPTKQAEKTTPTKQPEKTTPTKKADEDEDDDEKLDWTGSYKKLPASSSHQ